MLDAAGRVVFSRPTAAPVAHDLRPEQRRRLAAGRPLIVVAQEGPAVRALVYLAAAAAPGRGASFRLAAPAPDLEEELRERQQVFLGHLASLAALALAAALVLLPRERPSGAAPPEGALHAYEQAMERLRDQRGGDERAPRGGAAPDGRGDPREGGPRRVPAS